MFCFSIIIKRLIPPNMKKKRKEKRLSPFSQLSVCGYSVSENLFIYWLKRIKRGVKYFIDFCAGDWCLIRLRTVSLDMFCMLKTYEEKCSVVLTSSLWH